MLEGQTDEIGRVEAVHGGPPVAAVAQVAGDLLLAGDIHQGGDETVVAPAVHRGRESDDRRSDPSGSQGQSSVGVGDPRVDGGVGPVPLRSDAPRGETERAGGDQKRSARTREGVTECRDRAAVGVDGT